jgi:predicted DNA-binding transcriptional regulator YafY
LTTELEVSRRVIFNDRRFMIDRLRAPLACSKKRGGWYYTEANWALPTSYVTQGELLAFFLSLEVARRHMGTVLEAPLHSAIQKMAHSLRDAVNVDLETLRTHYSFASPAMIETNESTLLALHAAITQQQAMRIVYYTASRDVHSERVIHPHHLQNMEGDWYLVAFDNQRGRLTTFNVGRIQSWTPMAEHFDRDPSFDAPEWLRSMFQAEHAATTVDVVIRFDAYQARYIRERIWHETQTIEEQSDGGLIHCTVLVALS